MVRERRDGENVRINRAQGHLLDVAQGIGHGESALRIGIPDTYSHPGFRGDRSNDTRQRNKMLDGRATSRAAIASELQKFNGEHR